MGDRLARKIMFAIEHPDSSQEVSYITSEILYRGALKSDD
jgi:LacI family transcriptional regulator